MSNRAARRDAIAEWFREVAALVAVFPVIDQIVGRDAFHWRPVAAALPAALILLLVGLYLTRGER